MSVTRSATPTRPALARVLAVAAAGGLVMAVALGAGTEVGAALAEAAGIDGGLSGRLVPAVLVSALAVPPVLWAARRAGRRAAWLGLGGDGGAWARSFLVGVAVTATAALLVLGAGTAAGLLSWSRPEPATLVGFVAGNALVAVGLEALPEEVTLRGHAWATLRGRLGGRAAAFGTVAIFLLVPGASTVVAAATARLLGREPDPVGLAPGGQHPVDYLVLLTFFGLALVAARTAGTPAPLWTAIGTHLTFLTVNRVALEGEDRDAGWFAIEETPDAVLLVPAYLLVATAAFAALRRRHTRRRRRAARLTAG
ncbi:hypothetical protein E1265_30505 [Streptomyces sp. 8K308]|uniref:hypothetical protein n=1 Tax=Streptomyces sp. 8K308 TaxID=2530388 RepID=UPI00104FE893|nr:hypothetical protein [Streptomyces sp. 8K308]TDC10963.1 hypothetical protein E1265_30505 [Streptomyces sp. 8K308]